MEGQDTQTATSDMQGFLQSFDASTGKIKDAASNGGGSSSGGNENGGNNSAAGDKPATATTTAAATAAAPSGNEGANPAPVTTPTTDTKPAATAATAPVVPKLEDVLKTANPDDVFKQLGLDEFEIGFIKTRKNGGDPYKYLEVKSRDWSKMSDIDVIRHDLRQQYLDDKTPADDVELLIEDALARSFPPADQFTDEKEKRLAEVKRSVEANRLRKKYGEEDANWKIPERAPDNTAAEQARLAAEKQQEFIESIKGDEATTGLLTKKQLVAGEGEEVFNIEADPEKILDHVITRNKFWTLFDNGQGGLDLNKLYKAIQFAINPAGYEKSLIDYGKTLGTKKEADDLNGVTEKTGIPGSKSESLLEAFSKRGRDVPAA